MESKLAETERTIQYFLPTVANFQPSSQPSTPIQVSRVQASLSSSKKRGYEEIKEAMNAGSPANRSIRRRSSSASRSHGTAGASGEVARSLSTQRLLFSEEGVEAIESSQNSSCSHQNSLAGGGIRSPQNHAEGSMDVIFEE